jgi:CelD/BcsL family acetyltransferase involved in cellulose biosynthesis
MYPSKTLNTEAEEAICDVQNAAGSHQTAGVANCAVVVGLCAHGLAIARNLQAQGLEVIALESNPANPGTRTSAATVHIVDDINSDRLVQNLLWLRERKTGVQPLPLFLTNDRMVAVVARNIRTLEGSYHVPWSAAASTVLKLLSKNNIRRFADRAQLAYPESIEVGTPDALAAAAREFSFPVIVKPSQPLSQIKAIVYRSEGELTAAIPGLVASMPLVLQEYIEGPEENTRFAALVLKEGRVVRRLEGRKLRSRPLGHTTVAVLERDDALHEAAVAFFHRTGYCGVASLEMKRDLAGRYWVIEPTVGRTDFWQDLCLQSDPTFLTSSLGEDASREARLSNTPPIVWFNSHRDTLAPLWLWAIRRDIALTHSFRFSFLDRTEWRPFLLAMAQFTSYSLHRIMRRSSRLFSSQPAKRAAYREWRVECYTALEALPQQALALLDDSDATSFYDNLAWFRSYTREVMGLGDRQRWFLLLDHDDQVVAILPMIERKRNGLRIIRSMSNFYTPYFDVITVQDDEEKRRNAICELFKHLPKHLKSYDVVELAPIVEELASQIATSTSPARYVAAKTVDTVNWRLRPVSDYADYLATRPGRVRTTLSRKEKSLQRTGRLAIEILTSKDIDQNLLEFHAVYAKSWKRDEPYPEFISEIARAAAARGTLRLGKLTLSDTVIACQLWFVEKGVASIFKLAYDNDYHSYSPGTVLTFSMLKHAMDIDHVSCVDYLTGGDAYKAQLMSESRPLLDLQLINWRRPRGFLYATYRVTKGMYSRALRPHIEGFFSTRREQEHAAAKARATEHR